MLLFGTMTEGEAYDLLTLSELVSHLLQQQLLHVKRIQAAPPTRSDLHRAYQEASNSK